MLSPSLDFLGRFPNASERKQFEDSFIDGRLFSSPLFVNFEVRLISIFGSPTKKNSFVYHCLKDQIQKDQILNFLNGVS